MADYISDGAYHTIIRRGIKQPVALSQMTVSFLRTQTSGTKLNLDTKRKYGKNENILYPLALYHLARVILPPRLGPRSNHPHFEMSESNVERNVLASIGKWSLSCSET